MYIGTIEVVIVVITVANPELKRRYPEGCGSESGSRRENLRKNRKNARKLVEIFFIKKKYYVNMDKLHCFLVLSNLFCPFQLCIK